MNAKVFYILKIDIISSLLDEKKRLQDTIE